MVRIRRVRVELLDESEWYPHMPVSDRQPSFYRLHTECMADIPGHTKQYVVGKQDILRIELDDSESRIEQLVLRAIKEVQAMLKDARMQTAKTP